VLGLVAEGKTNQEIADALGISLDGAKWHMREILSKLGVERREQAAEYWREQQRWHRRAARLAKGLLLAPVARWLGAGAVSAVAIVAALLLVALLRDGGSPSAVEADLLPSEERAVPPFPAPADLGLAFIRDGNVWVKPVPDGREVQVTEDGGYYGPSWSPSGEWLAVQRNPNVILLGRYGRRVEAKSGDRNDWQWSPVRDELALVRLDSSELVVVDPSLGSERVPWKPETGKLGSRMAWSPDGTCIAVGMQVEYPATPVSKEDSGKPGTGEALLVVDVASGQSEEVARSSYALGAFVPAVWPAPGDWIVVSRTARPVGLAGRRRVAGPCSSGRYRESRRAGNDCVDGRRSYRPRPRLRRPRRWGRARGIVEQAPLDRDAPGQRYSHRGRATWHPRRSGCITELEPARHVLAHVRSRPRGARGRLDPGCAGSRAAPDLGLRHYGWHRSAADG
jgi:hypothetical protein